MGFRRVPSSILWSVFVVVVLIGGLCPDGTSAFPSGYDEVEGHNGDSDANTVVETANLTRVEREIDLRQNLHKHLKPFAALSMPNAKRPNKSVDKPVSPYYVRILKRRPGSSSKESSSGSVEDSGDPSHDVPKVLIDRRRNKDAEILPVVVVDSNGVPQRNRTVLVEKAHQSTPSPQQQLTQDPSYFNEFREDEDDEGRIPPYFNQFNPNPEAQALQSLPETREINPQSNEAPVTSAPFTPEQRDAPQSPSSAIVTETARTSTSAPSSSPNQLLIVEEIPPSLSKTTTTSRTTTVPTTTTSAPEISQSPIDITTTTTTSIPLISSTSMTTTTTTEEPSTSSSSTNEPPVELSEAPQQQQLPSTTLPTVSNEIREAKAVSDGESPLVATTVDHHQSTTELPPPLLPELPLFNLGPEFHLEGPISAEGFELSQVLPEESESPLSNMDTPGSGVRSPLTKSPSSTTVPTPSQPPPLPQTSSSSSNTNSFLPTVSDFDSDSSFSTLAVTKVLPNSSVRRVTSPLAQQDTGDEAMQASEIFSQHYIPSTTPMTTTTTTASQQDDSSTTSSASESTHQSTTEKSQDEVPTTALQQNVKNETLSPSPSSSSISSEQLQQLMKTALARLLIQQHKQQQQSSSEESSLTSKNQLQPEVSIPLIPHQIRLVENQPQRVEKVVFSSSSSLTAPTRGRGYDDLQARPTSPMPSILNALQNLISVTPRPTNTQTTGFSLFSQPLSSRASNNNNNIFSRLFPTAAPTAATPSFFDLFRPQQRPAGTATTTNSPFFFINLRTTEPSRLTSQSEVVTTKVPIVASAPTWQEFTGREVEPHYQQQQQQQQQQQKRDNPFPLGAILMAPVNLVMGMFKAASSFGQFMGNTINTFATAFSPNKNNRL